MATDYFKLPTVNDANAAMGFVDAANALAVASDAVLSDISDSFEKDPYELQPATTADIGGVRIGKGLATYTDGRLVQSIAQYRLPPATSKELGGVRPGRNVSYDKDGRIGVELSAYNVSIFDTAQFAQGAATARKINKGSVTQAKIKGETYNVVTAAQDFYKIDSYQENGLGINITEADPCIEFSENVYVVCVQMQDYAVKYSELVKGFSLTGDKFNASSLFKPRKYYASAKYHMTGFYQSMAPIDIALLMEIDAIANTCKITAPPNDSIADNDYYFRQGYNPFVFVIPGINA